MYYLYSASSGNKIINSVQIKTILHKYNTKFLKRTLFKKITNNYYHNNHLYVLIIILNTLDIKY